MSRALHQAKLRSRRHAENPTRLKWCARVDSCAHVRDEPDAPARLEDRVQFEANFAFRLALWEPQLADEIWLF